MVIMVMMVIRSVHQVQELSTDQPLQPAIMSVVVSISSTIPVFILEMVTILVKIPFLI